MEAKRRALDEIAAHQRRSQRWWMPAAWFKADRRRPNNLPSNIRQPPVTSNHSVPGSRVDVGVEVEGAKTMPETGQSDLVWQSAITCAALKRPKTSSCADDNFFLDKGHDPTSIDSLDKRKFRSRHYRMQRLRWHKKLQCHFSL